MSEYGSGPNGGSNNGQPNKNINFKDVTGGEKVLKDGIIRRAWILLIIIVAFVLVKQCVVITYPNEYNVVMQFGEIRSVTYEPGLSFKIPFIQSARSVPSNIRFHDIPISDVITQDKKTMVADSFVLWQVEDPTLFIRTLSGNVSSAESRISNISYNSMKNVISRLPQSEIISGRDTLANKIFDNIGDTLDQYGVNLIGIETKHLDLPDDNKMAVYTRMISERNNIAASFEAEGEEQARVIRNETDKSVSILLSQAKALAAETLAEGEKEYMEIMATAYNSAEKAEFYAFVRSLDAIKKAFNNGESTIILSSDSPIAQIFYSIN